MRREWKNRSCCSARLSIFKRLKISIFRHQPRKRWGEATRRDGRSKQGRDVPGGSGAAAPGMLLGTGTARDSEPGMRPRGDEGLHKAAGLRARGMLGPKRGCSVLRWNAQPQGKEVPIQGDVWPQGGMLSSWGYAQLLGGMLSTQAGWFSFPTITALVPLWDGMLADCTWISPQEWDVVPTVGGRVWKSHLQNPLGAFPHLVLQLPSPLCPGRGRGDAPWAGSGCALMLIPWLHLSRSTHTSCAPHSPDRESQAGAEWLE